MCCSFLTPQVILDHCWTSGRLQKSLESLIKMFICNHCLHWLSLLVASTLKGPRNIYKREWVGRTKRRKSWKTSFSLTDLKDHSFSIYKYKKKKKPVVFSSNFFFKFFSFFFRKRMKKKKIRRATDTMTKLVGDVSTW